MAKQKSENLENTEQLMDRINGLERRLADYIDSKERSSRWSTIIIPILSTIVALVGILSGVYVQNNSMQAQVEMNKFEVTFNAKQQGYANLMGGIEALCTSDLEGRLQDMDYYLKELPSLFYSIEPFITTDKLRSQLWDDMMDIVSTCADIFETRYGERQLEPEVTVLDFIQKRNNFRQILRDELFHDFSQ